MIRQNMVSMLFVRLPFLRTSEDEVALLIGFMGC